MPKEMLINVSAGEECRIALLEDGKLEELYMERTSATSHVGNIYKGKVMNVEASIQAAFIDFGLGRNGFLHISDLMPTYFGRNGSDVQETVGRKMARRDRPPIQRCLRRGDDIIVQIIKEGIGTKGPTLSTYLSIPGKMLVMMPGMGKMGVSKKIEDEQERRRLRQILDGLKPPKDVAFIIRTAGVGKSKLEIERDLKYLTRVWEQIDAKSKLNGPQELYTEGDLVARTVRDFYTPDIDRVVVDDLEVAGRVKDVIKISSPRGKNKVEVYDDPVPLFHRFGLDREIEQMYSRHVPLPSGGSLVIDSTEAIVAIDVNSGKNRDNNDAEMTAFRTDMEAAEEIPRQLKLRDLGGVIICDFIDLRYERHRRELEEKLFENFKNDRAKTKVLRMSQFGIIEITRQRMRPSLKRSIYFDCPHCKGSGLVKTPESMALDVMRKLSVALADERVVRAELSVCGDVAEFLLNKKREQLADLEHQMEKRIVIRVDGKMGLDEMRFELFDDRDGNIILEEIGMMLPERPALPGRHTQHSRGPREGGRSGGRNQPRRPTGPVGYTLVDRDEAPEAEEPDEERSELEQRSDATEEVMVGQPPRDRDPIEDREQDPDDIPSILETEAGDEVAEELADEEDGGGQSAGPGRNDRGGRSQGRDGGRRDQGRDGGRNQGGRDRGRKGGRDFIDNRPKQAPAARAPQAQPPRGPAPKPNRDDDEFIPSPYSGGPVRHDDDDDSEDAIGNSAFGPPTHIIQRTAEEMRRERAERGGRGRGKFSRDNRGGGQSAGNRSGGSQQGGRNPNYVAPRNEGPRNDGPRNDGARPNQPMPPRDGDRPFDENRPSGDQGGAPGEGGRRRRRRRGRRGRGRGQGADGYPQDQFDPNGPAAQQNVGPDDRGPDVGGPVGEDRGDEFAEEFAGEDNFDNESEDVTEPMSYDRENDSEGLGEAPAAIGETNPDDRGRYGDEDESDDESEVKSEEREPGVGTFNNVEATDKIGPVAEGGDAVAEEELNDRFGGRETEPEEARPAKGRRGRGKKAPALEPIAEHDEDAGGPLVLNDPTLPGMEDDEAPSPKRKGRPKRIPPAKKPKAAARGKKDDTVPSPDVVPTGSADKHLAGDEPVDPTPLSRPKSYSDLDAIPDDYD
jgi:ribonuclease E